METVTVTGVSGPNEKGWYEIELEDGRTPNTKNVQIFEAAKSSKGTAVEVTLNETVNGKFKNLYINSFGEIEDAKPARGKVAANNGGGSRPNFGGGKSADVQERIARQWAHGRAVELLIASGDEYVLPLDAATESKLQATADALLAATK